MGNDHPPPMAVSIPTAAKMTSLSEETIRTRIEEGRFPAKRIGRRWVIPVRMLEEWLNEQPRDGDAA